LKVKIETPISKQTVSKLSIGDEVYLTGEIVTARDMAHVRALEYRRVGKDTPLELENAVIYHCGPIVKKINGEWKVISAGPTTSIRMESVEADFIAAFKVRMIVGKGGMGERTASSLKKHSGVYCVFTGGAGALAAKFVKRVVGVRWLDLGVPEALWIFKVEDFGPLIVTIDSKGNNLHRLIEAEVNEKLSRSAMRSEK